MFSLLKRIFGRKPKNDTLYIGNLIYTATKQDLTNTFSKFGKIVNARVIRDNRTRKSRGYGFVTFSTEQAAKSALAMEGHEIKGRPVRVRFAHDRSDKD